MPHVTLNHHVFALYDITSEMNIPKVASCNHFSLCSKEKQQKTVCKNLQTYVFPPEVWKQLLRSKGNFCFKKMGIIIPRLCSFPPAEPGGCTNLR